MALKIASKQACHEYSRKPRGSAARSRDDDSSRTDESDEDDVREPIRAQLAYYAYLERPEAEREATLALLRGINYRAEALAGRINWPAM